MSEKESGEKYYRLTVNDRTMFNVKPRYRAGETVKLSIPFVTDVSTSITCDSTDIGKSTFSDGCYQYEFIMPPHDVNVTYKTYGNMMRMPTAAGALSFAEMSGAFICPSCRHVCLKTFNFCTECGRKLK